MEVRESWSIAWSCVAIVTGSNKGIGFEIARALASMPGHHVVACARDAAKGEAWGSRMSIDKFVVKAYQNATLAAEKRHSAVLWMHRGAKTTDQRTFYGPVLNEECPGEAPARAKEAGGDRARDRVALHASRRPPRSSGTLAPAGR